MSQSNEIHTRDLRFSAPTTKMAAPSKEPNSDAPSQADTPMTDANEEAITSVPVDSADAVSDVEATPACCGTNPQAARMRNADFRGHFFANNLLSRTPRPILMTVLRKT